MRMKETLTKVLFNVVDVIYQAIEDCIDSLTFSSGRKVQKTAFTVYAVCLVAIILRLFKLPTFLTYDECLMSALIALILQAADVTTKKKLKRFRKEDKNGL